jgi:hypothetical protein
MPAKCPQGRVAWRERAGGQILGLVYALGFLLAVVLYIGVVTLAMVRRGVSGAFLALTGTAIFGLWLTFFVISAAEYKAPTAGLTATTAAQPANGHGISPLLRSCRLVPLLIVFGIATIAGRVMHSR